LPRSDDLKVMFNANVSVLPLNVAEDPAAVIEH